MTFPSAPTGTSIADSSTVDWLGHRAADARRVADTGGDDVEGDCFLVPGFSEALSSHEQEALWSPGLFTTTGVVVVAAVARLGAIRG